MPSYCCCTFKLSNVLSALMVRLYRNIETVRRSLEICVIRHISIAYEVYRLNEYAIAGENKQQKSYSCPFTPFLCVRQLFPPSYGLNQHLSDGCGIKTCNVSTTIYHRQLQQVTRSHKIFDVYRIGKCTVRSCVIRASTSRTRQCNVAETHG